MSNETELKLKQICQNGKSNETVGLLN